VRTLIFVREIDWESNCMDIPKKNIGAGCGMLAANVVRGDGVVEHGSSYLSRRLIAWKVAFTGFGRSGGVVRWCLNG
jgi:hypothetical protein